MNLTTEVELARQFELTPDRVAELRRQNSWPHVRLGRFDVRYTEQQVEQIIKMHSAQPSVPVSATGPKIAGQTTRSARSKGPKS